ncbi:hypothetical protein [Jiangella asiatica]|uniref:Uncharacterized protein n=1 Tax=Jiangella asiatica TaxID=2530372 RepID=A0A4R5DTB0_9ACTN|nr:hypothetical protein [Jiangella asiatica]TDE14123.1 hypothetical protein E1269_05130 [Jiangella asiatica]
MLHIDAAHHVHRERTARLRHELLVAQLRRARRSERWAARSAGLASGLARYAQAQRARVC